MLGFMKKDIALVKSNFKFIVIFLVIFGFLFLNNQTNLSFIISYLSIIIMSSSFSYDSFNKWDSYAVTLPKGRKNSVRSKYAITIIFIIITSLIGIILSIIMSLIKNQDIIYQNLLGEAYISILITLLSQCIMYPIIYKLGVEKARIAIFVMVFGFIILGNIAIKYININFFINSLSKLQNYLFPISLILIISILFISYKLSERIYTKKEF